MASAENNLLFLEEVLELLPLIYDDLWELSYNYNQQAINSTISNTLSVIDTFNQVLTQARETRSHQEENSSSLVDLEGLQSHIRQLENLLQSCQEQTLTTNSVLLKQLWQTYTQLKHFLLTHLNQFPLGRLGILAKGELLFSLPQNLTKNTLATVQKLDTDLHEAMLNKDISQNLASLESILDNPNLPNQSTELKNQADIFHGLGELLEVSDLSAIASAVNKCLEHNSVPTHLITQRALACWQAVNTGLSTDLSNYQGENWHDYLLFRKDEQESNSHNLTPTQEILKTDQLFMWLAGFNIFFLPANSIAAMVIPQAKQVKHINNQQFFIWQEQNLPLYQLSALLNYNYLFPDVFGIRPSPLIVIIQRDTTHLIALEIEVEQPVVESELIIQSVQPILIPPNYVCGCTLLENKPMKLVIDVEIVLNQLPRL